MKRLAVVLAAALALGSTALTIGCSDKNVLEPEIKSGEAPAGLAVSNAVIPAAIPEDPEAAFGGAEATVAYISAAPGTFPAADSAFIRNATVTGPTWWIALSNGGFDPVAVNAKEGNVLSLTPFHRGVSGSEIRVNVPARQPPSIVRTTPANGLTRSATYLHTSVVFTEPVDASSITEATVALLRNGTPAQFTISVSEDRLSAELVSAVPLESATTYSLKIKGVRDLDGDVMVGENAQTFTTEQIAENSPVSTLAFVSVRDGVPHIYLANSNGTGVRRLTDGTSPEYAPTWSPDGRMLAFNGVDDEIYVVNRDGTGLRKLAARGAWPAWSPSNTQLVVVNLQGDKLEILNLDGSVAREFGIDSFFGVLGGDARPRSPRWSPDGQHITFTAFIDGADMETAFMVDTTGSDVSNVIFGQSATWYECAPVWSPDGKQLALLTGLYGIAVVDVGRGSPQTVFATPPGTFCWDGDPADARTRSSSGVDWSPDGRQVAVTLSDGDLLSVKVVDIASGAVRAVFRDAYDPAWWR